LTRHAVLGESIDREKVELEKRAKELAERHLYLPVRLLTNEDIRDHQGFDLCYWGDDNRVNPTIPVTQMKTFKVRKEDVWSDFKNQVAEQLGLSVSQIRFWNFYKRQNGTIRPEAPIPEKFDSEMVESVYQFTSKQWQDLRLYLEIVPVATVSATLPNDFITLFIKFYEPKEERLEYGDFGIVISD
jgi:ubiquitin carboxyl-terminal hydrolase 7